MTLAVGGTEAAVILVEQPTGGFKVSLRSRCALDCSLHCRAIWRRGAQEGRRGVLDKPLESARQEILDAVRAAMQSAT